MCAQSRHTVRCACEVHIRVDSIGQASLQVSRVQLARHVVRLYTLVLSVHTVETHAHRHIIKESSSATHAAH